MHGKAKPRGSALNTQICYVRALVKRTRNAGPAPNQLGNHDREVTRWVAGELA